MATFPPQCLRCLGPRLLAGPLAVLLAGTVCGMQPPPPPVEEPVAPPSAPEVAPPIVRRYDGQAPPGPPPAPPPPQPMALGQAVVTMLTSAWGESIADRNEADRLYAQGRLATSNPALDYAYLLTLMRQYRYPEAKRVADNSELTASSQPLPQMAVTWLMLVEEDRRSALEQLDRLIDTLAEREALDTQTQTMALFLGRALGVLEGPLRDEKLVLDVQRIMNRASQQLPDELARTVDEARQETLDRHDQLTQEAQRIFSEQIEQQVSALQQNWERIEQQLEAIQETAADVAARRQQLAAQANQALSSLSTAAGPIVTPAQALALRSVALQTDVALLASNIQRLNALARMPLTPAQFLWLERELNRFDFLLDAYYEKIGAFDWDAPYLIYGLWSLADEAAGIVARFQTAQAMLARRQQGLNQLAGALRRRQDQLSQRTVEPGPRARAQQLKADAVGSYLSFPLEEARRDLLAQFEAED